MINLISPSAKKKLWHQYLLRLGAVFFVAVAVLELFTVALFSPAFYSIHAVTTLLANDLEQQKMRSPQENKTISEEVKSVRGDLDILRVAKTQKNILPTAMIEEIVAVKPKGIIINYFAFGRVGDTANIQFSGVAAERDDILNFKTELGKNPLFTAPKSGDYIIKKTNIAFSIMLNVK